MIEILEQFSFWSCVDIGLVAIAIYHMLLLVRGTRTAQMLTGIALVIIAFAASSVVPLTTVNWVLSKFYSSIIVIIIILFQDDIRLALSRIGNRSILAGKEEGSYSQFFEALDSASSSLAASRIGALVVLERNIILSRYVDIGVTLDASVSRELLVSIFHPSSPIHDGAVIVQRGRVAAAGCFLPLSKKDDLEQHFGTRHRAALGISQETDAAVIMFQKKRDLYPW